MTFENMATRLEIESCKNIQSFLAWPRPAYSICVFEDIARTCFHSDIFVCK